MYRAGLALCVGLSVLRVQPDLQFVSDDAWISFRYAWNLVHGHGLIWSQGVPPVEGYSNLTWTLWSAVGIALGAPVTAWVQGWGMVLTGGTVVATAACVRVAGGGRLAALGAALLVASSTLVVQWGTIGLETPLFTLGITAGMWRALAEDRAIRSGEPVRPWSLVLFGLVAVTRPEGVLYLAIPVLLRLRRRRVEPPSRRDVAAVALLLVPTALQMVVRLCSTGDLVAGAYHAKVHPLDLSVIFHGLRYLAGVAVYNPAFTALIAVGAALAVAFRRWFVAAPALITAAFILLVGGDTFAHLRFVAPAVPAMVAVALAGLDVGGRVRRGRNWRRAWAAVMAVLLLAAVRVEWLTHQVETLPPPPPRSTHVGPGVPPPEASSARLRRIVSPPLIDVQRLGLAIYPRALFPQEPAADPTPEWFLLYLLETLPAGGAVVFADVGLVGYALGDLGLLDARGLNWGAMGDYHWAFNARGQLEPDSPEVKAVLEEFRAVSPDVLCLQCNDEGLIGEMEALLWDAGEIEPYRFIARGPYFDGTGDLCVYRREGSVAPDAGRIAVRYDRLNRELPGVRDWPARQAALQDGSSTPVEAPYTNRPAPRAAASGLGWVGR